MNQYCLAKILESHSLGIHMVEFRKAGMDVREKLPAVPKVYSRNAKDKLISKVAFFLSVRIRF
jgi:hypothetical protein